MNPESPSRDPLKESEKVQGIENAKNDDAIGAPVALPPKFGDSTPLAPGQTGTQYMPNGLPALTPKGINADTLFSEQLKDSGDRFDRVENAVVDLRKEFESYRPSIVRLAAVESDIQNLIKELEVLLQETPAPRPPLDLTSRSEPTLQVEQLDPQPQPPPEPQNVAQDQVVQQKAQPPPRANAPPPDPTAVTSKPSKEISPAPPLPEYDGVVATNLRIGEHADKVRVVIDTNQKTKFSIDLDNTEKLIVVELPDARWVGKAKGVFKDMKLIESFETEPLKNGKGTLMIIALKKGTSIIQEKRLAPDRKTPYHRIYFDLKP